MEAENVGGEKKGEEKAKGLIAQKGKGSCPKKKMREDDDGRAEGV